MKQETRQAWLGRWEDGNTGWHQAGGNSALRRFWPGLDAGPRVLVPLCGKSTDLLWLAEQGFDVTGVELSGVAVRAFFSECGLRYREEEDGDARRFTARDHSLTIIQGDYFRFAGGPFDALYDRASLVALPADLRPVYVAHTRSLLNPGAAQLLLTVEYDQARGDGPPYSVSASEVMASWPRLRRVADRDDRRNMPPRLKEAGIDTFVEAVWAARRG